MVAEKKIDAAKARFRPGAGHVRFWDFHRFTLWITNYFSKAVYEYSWSIHGASMTR
jgi:hypothetical protein